MNENGTQGAPPNDETGACPECGAALDAAAPRGLCPACLLIPSPKFRMEAEFSSLLTCRVFDLLRNLAVFPGTHLGQDYPVDEQASLRAPLYERLHHLLFKFRIEIGKHEQRVNPYAADAVYRVHIWMF